MGIRCSHSSRSTGLLSNMTFVKLVSVYPGLQSLASAQFETNTSWREEGD